MRISIDLQNYDDGDKATGRAYGHALVVGLSKEPRKVCHVFVLSLLRGGSCSDCEVSTVPAAANRCMVSPTERTSVLGRLNAGP